MQTQWGRIRMAHANTQVRGSGTVGCLDCSEIAAWLLQICFIHGYGTRTSVPLRPCPPWTRGVDKCHLPVKTSSWLKVSCRSD